MHELTICTFSITKSTDKTLKIILAKLSKIVLKIDILTLILIHLLVKSESAYSDCYLTFAFVSRKNFVVTVAPFFSFLQGSSVGSRTFQVAKFLLQVYLAGIRSVFNVSSKTSFLRPARVLVFKS